MPPAPKPDRESDPRPQPDPDPVPTPGERGGPETPNSPNAPKTPGAAPTRRTARVASTPAWRYWWEFNRATFMETRHLLQRHATITGNQQAPRSLDTLREHRGDVLAALRTLAGDSRAKRELRAAALVALGRAGGAGDEELLIAVVRDSSSPTKVREAAALALGLLRSVKDNAAVRALADEVLSGRTKWPGEISGLMMLSAGLRARGDRLLASRLASSIVAPTHPADPAALALACGLAGDVRTLPELVEATTKARLGRARLDDVARSHAALALGRIAVPAAAPVLVTVLNSRSAGVQTRRSAALSLGRMLREGQVEATHLDAVHRALEKTLRNKGDSVLRGFAALALAGDKQPQAIDRITAMLDSGRVELRPYAALALGLAARNLGDGRDPRARKIRKRLTRELSKTSTVEMASALSIAAGLAGARDALPDLLARVAKRSLPVEVRGAAAVGAGMLRYNPARTEEVLLDALRDSPGLLAGEIALGLGLTGRREVARVLLERIAKEQSSLDRGRIVLALGYLGSTTTVAPLLAMLQDKTLRPADRAQAAIALGLLGDRRDQDVLFGLGADFNFLATTRTTWELFDQM